MKRLIIVMVLLAMGLPAISQDLVLENSNARLSFSEGNRFLFKSFVMEGRELLPPAGSTANPWQITLLGPRGETPWLHPGLAWYDGGKVEDGKASFTWRLFLEGRQDWKLTMTISLSPEDELPRWALETELPQGWVITDLDFPRIDLRSADEDKAILPIGYGVEYSMKGTLQSTYPSCTGTMQLVLLHNPEGTVYFSACDPSASRKSFSLSRQGGAVTLSQTMVASYGWTRDGVFRLPWESVLGFSKASWQETALKWYRPFTFSTSWGAKTLLQRDITPWIKEADIWLRPDNVTPDTMEALREMIPYYGKGTGLHWYIWHKYPFDTNYPDYLPAKDGFSEMVKEARELGGKVTPYINGRLWDPANETYSIYDGASASCRRRDGSLYTEVYSSKAVNTVTCPSSPVWNERMRDICSRIISELGTDGVYIDQIGAAIGEPCYSSAHPHPKGGGCWWPEAYRSMLQGMHKDIFTSGMAVTTEENAECYIDLFDMMLVVNSPHNPSIRMVPLFPLIYSDRCVYSGYTYIPSDLGRGVMNFISMKSLLWGSQLGWIDPRLIMKFPAEKSFLKTLASFRKANHDIFFGGLFLGEFIPGGDNPVVDVPGYQKTPVVTGAAWQSVKGEKAYVLVNMDASPRKVTLPGGEEITIQAYSAIRL